MKLNFDIKFRPQIESGEYTVFIKNYPVHILRWDSNTKDGCIVGYWGENENIYVWDKNGKHASSGNKENNLYIIAPDPEPENHHVDLGIVWDDETTKTFIIDTLGKLRTSGKPLHYLINLDIAIEWLEKLPITEVSDNTIESHTDEELDEFTENIRKLITKKLTYHSPDGTMSSTVFIDNETAKDIANGILFYVAQEAFRHPDKEILI